MFTEGSNDPRASVPPSARDSTYTAPSLGGGLSEKPCNRKEVRLERGNRDKALLGRREWACETTFTNSLERVLCSSEAGILQEKLYERCEQGDKEKNIEGKREWSMSKLSADLTQIAAGSPFSNGSALSHVSKRYPGRHGFYKENGRYGSRCDRTGDALHFVAFSNDKGSGKAEQRPQHAAVEAASGCLEKTMGPLTKDLNEHVGKKAGILSGQSARDCSGALLEKKVPSPWFLSEVGHVEYCERLKDGSKIRLSSPGNSQADNGVALHFFQKNSASPLDDISLSKNVNRVYDGLLTMCSSNHLESCREDFLISKSTLGSSPKQSSLERVVSVSSRRSALAAGNGFSEDLIAKSHSSLDTSILPLSPKSTSNSAAVASSLSSAYSADNSSPRKRPRLGWGQGLAKYEQRKVEGSISPPARVTVCGGNSKMEANDLPHTDDPHSALKSYYRLPSAASFTSSFDANAECLSKSEVLGTSSIKAGSSFQSLEEVKACTGGIETKCESENLPENSVLKIFGDIESPQLETDQVSACTTLELPVFEKFIEVSGDFSAKNEPLFGVGDFAEENNKWIPKDYSGWTKQEISNGIEKLEFEIDLVEKELSKLNGGAGDDLQSGPVMNFMRETDQNMEYMQCSSDKNLEVLHVSEETGMVHSLNDVQNPQSLPCDVSDHLFEPTQQEAEDACDNVEVAEANVRMISEEESDAAKAHDKAEITDANEVDSTEAGHSGSVAEDNLLADMRKLHLSSAHALIKENRLQSMQASRPFIHLLPESTLTAELELESHPDALVWEHKECGSMDKEQMLEKLAKHKHSVRFKEKVLGLRYRALKELWRQEQLVSAQKKDRSKSYRKTETERKSGTVSVTPRSSLRLRPSPSGSGKMDTVLDEVKVMSKALVELSDELVRPFLKMPAMLLDDREQAFQKFNSKNGLVEDPVSLEREREAINPWTSEERQIFLDKFALFNKSFSQIASYLEHKSTADCVVFYYKNHKSEDFEKIRRRHQLKKRRDHSRASASYLATTVLPAGIRSREGTFPHGDDIIAFNPSCREVLRPGRTSSHRLVERAHLGGPSEHRSCISGALTKSTGAKESKAASNLLAVAAGMASGASYNSCTLSTSLFPSRSGIDSNFYKENFLAQVSSEHYQKPHSNVKRTCMLHVKQDVGKPMGEQVESKWNDAEKSCFVDALGIYGKDFKRIAQHVKTKTVGQCKIFFSKSCKRLNLQQIVRKFQASSHASVEADADTAQPNSNSGLVTVEDFVSCMDASIHSMDLHRDHGEPIMIHVEATMKQPENLVLEPPALRDDMKVDSEDGGNHIFTSEDTFGDCHPSTLSNSPDKLKVNSPELLESTAIQNQLCYAHAICPSSVTVAESDIVNTIKDVPLYGSEGCSYSPTKASETLKTQVSDSVVHIGEALDLVATSCTASSGVPLNEHESLCKKPKLEADSPSISSSVPPEPSSSMIHHLLPHAARTVSSAAKISHTSERNVKSGIETRTRREATSWALDEKEIFAETIKKHGKDWAILQEHLPSKSMTQIKTYFQNSKARLGYAPDNVVSSVNLAFRKRKVDESDPYSRTCGKLNCQKSGQSITNDSSLNSSSGDVNSNLNISAVSAEQHVYDMLAQNVGDVGVAKDMQRLFHQQFGPNGLSSQAPVSSKQLSESGISENTPSSGHIFGSMPSQLLSNSFYANIQQQIISNCKHPSSNIGSQQQTSVVPLQIQQHQATQSTSKQQLAHTLHPQHVLSLAHSVLQSQQLPQSGSQQLMVNHHPQSSLPLEVQASSILGQKLAHQLSQRQSSSPNIALSNQQLLNHHVALRLQQYKKQATHPQQQQLQQVTQLQMLNPLSPDGASHAHKQVVPPHQTSTRQQAFTKQQQHCQLLNQQMVADQQQSFVQQQQQLALKHEQQVFIQQKQLHQALPSQILQRPHDFFQQQQLKKTLQQSNAMNMSQNHLQDGFSLQMLQHSLHSKASQQLLQQTDIQIPNCEESVMISKQPSKTRAVQQQLQTRSTVTSLKGTLERISSASDVLNPADTEPRRLQVSSHSVEDSQCSQPDLRVPSTSRFTGGSFSEAQPSRSGDVKLFGQSLLSQPSSSGSKSSSASPPGNGHFLLQPYSPSPLASAFSMTASPMLTASKYLGIECAKSGTLEKEVRHSPSQTHPGGSFTTVALGLHKATVLRTGSLESHGGQEAAAYMAQRFVQNQGSELRMHIEPSDVSSPPSEFHRGSQEVCRDGKSLCTANGLIKIQGEQTPLRYASRAVSSSDDAGIDSNYTKLDERSVSAGKSVGQPAYPIVNQGISQGVLDAIMAITSRQTGLALASASSGPRGDNSSQLRSVKNVMELPTGSGLAKVINCIGGSCAGEGETSHYLVPNHLPPSQLLNVATETMQRETTQKTAGGSHAAVTDPRELVPKHSPVTQSIIEVPLRPPDS